MLPHDQRRCDRPLRPRLRWRHRDREELRQSQARELVLDRTLRARAGCGSVFANERSRPVFTGSTDTRGRFGDNRIRHGRLDATGDGANVLVKLVRDRDLFRTISTFYGSERAREIKTSLDPQCLSGFRKNDKFEIEHSDVILTVDKGDFIFLDCAYEELLQSLGPINDTSTVPWTMFNDNVSMGYFDVYDQYIMNVLYDPRVKAGMTVAEVKAVLPDVLADVRAWVRKVNNLEE